MCRSRTSEAASAWVLAVFLAVLTACGGGKLSEDPASARTGGLPASTNAAASADAEPVPSSAPARSDAAALDWQDPEPPGTQALAESVVNQPFNADRTTGLVMRITTIVDRTTGITGFATTLEPEEATLKGRLDALGAQETDTEVTIRLPGTILFDFDSATIRPDAERTLSEVVKVLAGYRGRPARVEGHTDSIASDAYNRKLSKARAASVAGWLAAHGIDGSRLKTIGWGETRPVADNATPKGRQQNRRVEIIIEKKQGSS